MPPVLLLLLLKRALEGGPSERQHLLGVGFEVSEWVVAGSVAGGHRSHVVVLAAPPCTAGT